MKRIIVFQENTSAVEMLDPDKSNLEEYTKKLYKILSSGNISLLITPLSSLIIKPSKITSILVEEVAEEANPFNQKEEMAQLQQVKEVKKEKEEEKDVDIITDIDE